MNIKGNQIIIKSFCIEVYLKVSGLSVNAYWRIKKKNSEITIVDEIENLDYAVFLAENRLKE